MSHRLDEETRQLLRRVVETFAWRQYAAVDILGHCLKFVSDLETKRRVAAELDLSLRLLSDVRDLHAGLGWVDLEAYVRERVRAIPFPESRLEFGVAFYVTGRAEAAAMRAYVDSCSPELAAIARSHVDAAMTRPEPARFREFCAEPTQRPQAQQFFTRWLTIAIRSLGRPGTPADARTVELGLRSVSSAELVREYLGGLAPFVESCQLAFPDFDELGVEVEAGR
jgi:hypothetical protein